MKRWILGILVLGYLLVRGSGVALAGSRHPLLVPAGGHAHDVVVVGQDVVIAGRVEGEVIVLFGNLRLEPTAHVQDDIVVIGGTVSRDPAADIRRSVYTFALGGKVLSGLGWGLATYAFLAGLKLLWITATVLAAVLWGLWPQRAPEPAKLPSLWRLLAVGALWGIALLLMTGGLSLTLWGIPLALILVLITLVLSCLGLGMLSMRTGTWLMAMIGRRFPPWQTGALGSGALVLLTGVPGLGVVVLAVLVTAGLGQFVLAIRHGQLHKKGGPPTGDTSL